MNATELEAAILRNRGDDAAWKVYADFLQQQGDVRGELIVLATTDGAAWSERLSQHYSKLFPPITKGALNCTWVYGHVGDVIVTPEGKPLAPVLKALLEAPIARFMHGL